MNNTVAVVDYEMGNLRSVSQAVMTAAQGTDVRVIVTQDPAEVRAASRIVLPGQGAMRDCMAALKASGLQEAVLEAAATKPLFGVCVGMQMLLDHSEEGDTPSLGLIPGEVKRFDLAGAFSPMAAATKCRKWAGTRCSRQHPAACAMPMWEGIPDGAYFYFVHSFYAAPADAAHCAAETDYGGRFASALARDKIFATQFHPEKSADHGIALYRNFLHWNP